MPCLKTRHFIFLNCLSRIPQIRGNRPAARLCACRRTVDEVDGGYRQTKKLRDNHGAFVFRKSVDFNGNLLVYANSARTHYCTD